MKSCWVYLVLFISFLNEATLSDALSRQLCSAVTIKNGKVRRQKRGRFLKYSCNRGYLLAGEKHSACFRGEWDPPPPKCVRPTCAKKPQQPSNGFIYPTHGEAVAHFFCKPGYVLRGPETVYCDGTKWDNNSPTCLAVNTKPKLFCDFEESDICGWMHDLNHDFDWRRENYNTPSGSIGTGPSFDHTKGVGKDGYYMYIESSSKNENDTARLISPIFDATQDNVCLEFYYHMFGATTGSLIVYLKRISDSWNLDPESAIFSKSGNQGDRWYRSYQSLGTIQEQYQIVIEGVRGPGYVSDIAVDDIKIIENCSNEEDYTTTMVTFNTEIIQRVDSCENRCDQTESTSNETYLLSCDCDDSCYERNRCCPDYFDYCALLSSVSTTMDEITTGKIYQNEWTTMNQQSTEIVTPKATTSRPITRKQLPTTKYLLTTSRKVLPNITRTPLFFTTRTPLHIPWIAPATVPSKLKPIKTFPSTLKPQKIITSVEKRTTKPTPKAKLSTRKYLRPTIYVLTPPITTKIVRKTIPTAATKLTTLESIYSKLRPLKPYKETDSNDVVEIPNPANNDEALLLTSPISTEDDRTFSKNNVLDADVLDVLEGIENNLDSPTLRNFSESHKLYSERASEGPHSHVLYIILGITCVAVLGATVAFVVRRYRCTRSRMNFSNGESQSDVRFLTGDEILDFSLDKEYDEL